MSRECREDVVCRPSSATLDFLATFSRRTTNQLTVNMIYRENVACRPKITRSTHSILSKLNTTRKKSVDSQSCRASRERRENVVCRPVWE
ncbi:hypothetical protein DPMN_118501 [Dreissena polymorpha]|uniref:Uncharacterized protein n=1 Tax=Dreissena polymorpha TaxID=45954 RepID=A0A9D4GGJ9_DREPO|nr:hypothetical protein DPMN_118501 [Dreissena polymorpha]